MSQTEVASAPADAIAALQAMQSSQRRQLQAVEAAQEQLAAAHRDLVRIERDLARLVQQQRSLAPADTTAQPAVPSGTPATLILNPAAKVFLDGVHTPEEIVALLEGVGVVVTLAQTTLTVDAYQLAREAVTEGATLVIAAGGDGTIEEVAAALVDTETVLGILPLGTMNNVARVLGIPLDLPGAAVVLAMGAIRHIDVGHVITPDHAIDGYFLETAGIGLSAVAAPMGEAYEKGRWADVFSKLGEFLAGTSTQATVRCDDDEILQAQTHTLTISNAPLFGNNMLIAPDAKLDDGFLDLAIYADMELVDLTTYFYAISNGGRTHEPRLLTKRARHIHITTDVPLAVNADLDVLDKQQSWEIQVKPHALAIVVGNGFGLTFPVAGAPMPPPIAGPPWGGTP
ncbi:MAG: diacylglycerol kinase family lipid kinase [Caldilineaceae bacterium]|nr:diacylglycerol kinase family lipid kinase [Caldilineaceae bacterium]